MYKASFVGGALLALSCPARATWSVVGVDPVTREVGVAVATCVPEPNGSRILPQVAGVAPGIGALAAQAQFNQQTRDRALALLRMGAEPQAILDQVNASDPGSAQRQYGIVTLADGAANHTGAQNLDWASAAKSQVVSVQGNILVGREVVDDALRAFGETEPCEDTLADKLLRALEAGGARGGDSRCAREQGALVAVLRVAAPGEDGDHPALDLVVTSPRESTSPVALLRQAYDRHRAEHPARACEAMADAGPLAPGSDAGSAACDASASTADARIAGASDQDASAAAANVTDASRNDANGRDAGSVDAAGSRTAGRDARSDARASSQESGANEDDDDEAAGAQSRSRRSGGGCTASRIPAEDCSWGELVPLVLVVAFAAYEGRRPRGSKRRAAPPMPKT